MRSSSHIRGIDQERIRNQTHGDIDQGESAGIGFHQVFRQRLELLFQGFHTFLVFLSLRNLEIAFSDIDELTAFEIGEILRDILIDRFVEDQDFKVLLFEFLDHRGVNHFVIGLSAHIIDHIDVRITFHVLSQGGVHAFLFRSFEPRKFQKFLLVGFVLDDTVFHVLAVFLPERTVFFLVFLGLSHHVEELLDGFLGNRAQDLVLLEGFTVDIQRQIIRVDDTVQEAQILRQ